MSSLPALLLLFLCASLPTTSALPSKERHFKWEVEYIYWSPDCVENMMIGINGRFPGPTIRARVGDTIVVELKNRLPTEGVVIHWHGIRQFGTPWYDGAASISQCAINPEETFVYFYHGHYGMQRAAGLYGSLLVDLPEGVKEPFHYDGELNLLLSDWWHRSVQDQMTGLSARPFRWIDEPQTLLINGRGQYNCSLAAQAVNGTSAAQLRNGTMTCEIASNECAPVVLKVLFSPNLDASIYS